MDEQEQSFRETLEAALDDAGRPFALLNKIRVKDKAAGDRLEAAMRRVTRESRKEAGNITYHVNRDASDPTVFYLYDRWRSIDAVEAHQHFEHFQDGLVTLKEVIAGPPEVTILQIVDEIDE